jgi:glutaconate CoA-transferase subunit A
MEVTNSGRGELFQAVDLDSFRAYMREHKQRNLVNKVMSEQDAVAKFVSDGDYIAYDCDMLHRGPASLVREIIRQRKKNLGVAGKFTYFIINLLVTGGCVDRIDVGYIGLGLTVTAKRINEGKIKITEWSNSGITMRLLAGSLGVPFMPVRFLGGTDIFPYSAARQVKDPFTGKEIVLVPALNPDVSLVHVNQCDIYGNSRIFGTSVAPVEVATSAKKLIVSTEEIIDTEEIKKDPARTTIPHYFVDAVVEAPFGGYPGEVAGLYVADMEHVAEIVAASGSQDPNAMTAYIEKYIYSVGSHQEFLDKRVGLSRLLELRRRVTIKEGYYL